MPKPRRFPKIRISDHDRIDAVKHWQKVLQTAGLPQIAYDSAIEALKKLGGVPERVPGEDDDK